MSEVDSPPESAEDIGPQDGQEPSVAPKNSPEKRINGLMSVLGRRTAERDAARREKAELQQQLDSAFAADVTAAATYQVTDDSTDDDGDEAEAEDDDVVQRYTLDEAKDIIETSEQVGHIDANNPSRQSNSRTEPGLADMKRELDSGWSRWQQDAD